MQIAPRKRRALAVPKCVGLVLRPGMKQREFRRVEQRLDRNRLASLPVIVGASAKRSTLNTPICGLVVVGSDAALRAEDQHGLESIVRDAIERQAPVLALSDAVPIALSALGEPLLERDCAGVLINKRVERLAYADIDRAIDRIGAGPPRA